LCIFLLLVVATTTTTTTTTTSTYLVAGVAAFTIRGTYPSTNQRKHHHHRHHPRVITLFGSSSNNEDHCCFKEPQQQQQSREAKTLTTTTTTVDATAAMTTTTTTTIPTWCPDQQIYVGGILPDLAEIDQLLHDNNGTLCLFGYGSLCWNPGTPGESALADPTVTSKRATALGYRRCWAQKSNDHRGTPAFPGIVCTLLQDAEVDQLRSRTKRKRTMTAAAAAASGGTTATTTTTTEGVLFFVPPPLVQACLEELDFREKCGYGRDVIQVVEDDTGLVHSALLYRGTPDNPAIWPRALNDLQYAAGMYIWMYLVFKKVVGLFFVPWILLWLTTPKITILWYSWFSLSTYVS
jgi:cation transport regulator ChaC